MELLTKRINQAMRARKMQQVDLCAATNETSSKISQLVNGKVTDPRLSSITKIAEALDVSLDYLAGRTDNPSGMCDEELEGLRIDSEARALLRGFDLLPPEGKDAIQEQVDFQLSKSQREVQDNPVSGVA